MPAKSKKFQAKHDVILFYSKTNRYTFNPIMVPGTRVQKDIQRGWGTDTLVRDGEKIRRLRVYDKAAVQQALNKGILLDSDYGAIVDQTQKTGDTPCSDVWEINLLNPMARERLGYPTQKPLALYERMILASSNPDDLVLDPFCGCGTTVVAARNNSRHVIGIDVLPFALRLINEKRLDVPFPVEGTPVSMETAIELAQNDPFKFQDWAISLVDGLAANPRKTGDEGIDGFGMFYHEPDNMDTKGIIVQVTGAAGSQKTKFDKLQSDVRTHNAAMGILITRDEQTARNQWRVNLPHIRMGNTSYDPIQCFSIAQYYEYGEKWDNILKLPPLTNPWTGKLMQQTELAFSRR